MSVAGRAALAVAVGALATACASESVVGVRHRAAPAAPPVTSAAPACTFHLVAVDDHRDRQDLGQLFRSRVDGKGFPGWFSAGIESMPGQVSGPAPVTVRIELLKAYMQSVSTMMAANLVVRVHTQVAGQPVVPKLYRSADRSTNWFNAEAEVQNSFDRAMADLTAQLGTDLSALCPR